MVGPQQPGAPGTTASGVPTPTDASDALQRLSNPQAGAAGPSPAGPSPSAAAPAGVPSPLETSLGGIRLRTDEGMAEHGLALEQRKFQAQVQRARELYTSLQEFDKDFTLRDALRAAGMDVDIYRGSRSAGSIAQLGSFGAYLSQKMAEKEAAGLGPWTGDDTLNSRAEFYAQNRSMGVGLESVARMLFDKPPQLLTPEELTIARQKVTSLIGTDASTRSYASTAATEQAQFNAPIDPATAKATNLPVGTTGPQVAGQTILTDAEQKTQSSLTGVLDSVKDIRDRLVPAALPRTREITGTMTAGAEYQYRKRISHPEQIAALEAAVANTVNALARAREQSGAQTEPDIRRAEQALVQTQTSLINGDTVETSTARINESLKILEDVLGRLPKQAVPVTPAARTPQPARTGGATRPPQGAAAPPTDDPARRTRARQALLAGGYQTDDATIAEFLRLNPGFR